MRARIAAVASLVALVVATTTTGNAATGERYEGGGTVAVAKINGVTVVDNGAAICRPGGASTGGACVPFGEVGADGRGFVYLGVDDDTVGEDVAFQVCIDNNGDGVCSDFGQEPAGKGCLDQVYFSHGDDGLFHNPLGPLPSSRAPGCNTTTGWIGYIVFICEGVHVVKDGSANGGTPHVHPATTGTVSNAPSGTGYGNFCGSSNRQPVEKDYKVIP